LKCLWIGTRSINEGNYGGEVTESYVHLGSGEKRSETVEYRVLYGGRQKKRHKSGGLRGAPPVSKT